MGTRLRPITNSIPKCLVPIHGIPLLDYWLKNLVDGGIEKILVNTHYLPHLVQNHISSSDLNPKIEIFFEKELLGTGGSILANIDFFGGIDFFVAHADNLTKFDLKIFQNAHFNRPKGTEITMMTFDTDSPHSCGIVQTDNNGIVTDFYEKELNPPGNRANAAVYIMSSAVLSYIKNLEKKSIDISTDIIPAFIGRIFTFHNDQYHRDIGTPESLRLANIEFLRNV
jgi:mannose-1-phosphate guanylyltransferase